MRSQWTAVGGLLLIAFTSAAVSVQDPAPSGNEDKSDPGLPQPADQNDPAPSRPDDQNDLAPSRPDDQKYPGPPLPANEGAATGGIATTTTLDPLDEYCKEACEAGFGGAMCDCPEHPIG